MTDQLDLLSLLNYDRPARSTYTIIITPAEKQCAVLEMNLTQGSHAIVDSETTELMLTWDNVYD